MCTCGEIAIRACPIRSDPVNLVNLCKHLNCGENGLSRTGCHTALLEKSSAGAKYGRHRFGGWRHPPTLDSTFQAEVRGPRSSCARWPMEAMAARTITIPGKCDVRGGGIKPGPRDIGIPITASRPFLSAPSASDWPSSGWRLADAPDFLAFYIPTFFLIVL